MRDYAASAREFFSEYAEDDFDACYASCITYAQAFIEHDSIELQFLDSSGQMVASSQEKRADRLPSEPDVHETITTKQISTYVGRDEQTGMRIMAVSSPVTLSDGTLVGVLRYVTPTAQMDRQTVVVIAVSVGALCVFVLVMLFSSNYYIRSILVPLGEIIDKAEKIANGSYGIQIQTKFDDEIGDLAHMINEMSVKISENEKMQRDMCSWANWKKVYPILCLESMRIRIPKGIYCHYKGNRYQVEGVALHSETLEPMVIYRALYGMEETWVRPASMWLEWIEVKGKRVRRFEKEE